jgi:hypothetical protein
MQHWEILIIPLLGLVVWILSTIFKGEDPNEVRMRTRRADGNRPGQRRATAPEGAVIVPPRRRSSVDDALQTTAAPPPVRVVQRPSRPRRLAVPVPVQILEEPPVLLPVRELDVTVTLPVPQPAVILPSVMPPPSTPQPARPRAVSPVLGQVFQLLRSPRSAAVAVVLREILDRPVGQRRR